MDLIASSSRAVPSSLPGSLSGLVRERLFPRPGRPFGPIWIQGVSVGEVEVASTLAGVLSRRRPGIPLLLTSTTPAGVALLSRRFPPGSGPATRPFPLDLPRTVLRFFDFVGPRVLVLVETELWPVVLATASRRGTPVLLASARLSHSSTRRYVRYSRLFRGPLAALTRVLARTDRDADAFVEIGIPQDRVTVSGDLKYDREVPADPPFASRVLRLAAGRPILVAGSIAEEEIPIVASLPGRLAGGSGRPFLLLAPRRTESFSTASRALETEGLRTVRRSVAEAAGEEADAFLLDTVGELASAYRLGTIALLGGTFAPKGGHNVLEPLSAGLPVLVGPSTGNIREAVAAAGAAVRTVPDENALAPAVALLLADPFARARAADAARRLFAANRGAAARAADAALALLDAPPGTAE